MTATRRTKRLKLNDERGQSMVEFAVILPILVMLLLAIWQVGVVFHNYLTITDAARVGARAAAVNRATPTGSCQAARNAIQATVSAAQWTRMNSAPGSITCTPTAPGPVGSSYKVSITYPFQFNIFIARPQQLMTASATERLE
jgi:Flp pilus assembly protein TadG